MKKIICLLILMFSLVLVNTSCEKEKEDPEPEGITVNDLIGNWNFVSLEFNGKTYTDCDAVLNQTKDLVTMNILDVTTTSLRITSDCVDMGDLPINAPRNYKFSNNIITVVDGGGNTVLEFEIKNAETFNRTILKLKLINQGVDTVLPVGGTYTLTK